MDTSFDTRPDPLGQIVTAEIYFRAWNRTPNMFIGKQDPVEREAQRV
jgi:hypothetical protein